MSYKVLIAGATGDTGRVTVKESLALGLSVRGMVHRMDARSAALEKLGAEVVGDLLEINTIRTAMEGVDAAYLCWPVTPGLIHATVNFAQAAKEPGVSAIINLSQRSANRESTSDSCRDSFLAEEVLNWSGLPIIHLRPTYFLEWLLYPWPAALCTAGHPPHAGRQGTAPIAVDEQGRATALLKHPEEHIGRTIPRSGPVKMDHEQMAEELTEALGRRIVFQDLSIDEYCTSIEAMGVPPYVVQHLRGAMADYQTGHMSGADNNVEKLTGQKPMSVGEFARAHSDILNPK
jgi:NAD(P)H dehydrogenase (quinone)